MLGDYRLCREQVAQVGDEPVVESCAPPTVTDFPVVAVLVLVLIAPDVTEVSVGSSA